MEDLSSDSEAVVAALHGSSTHSPSEDDHAGAKQRGGRRTLRSRQATGDSDASLSSHHPRSRSASLEEVSELEVESQVVQDVGEDENMATSDDDAPTPTKFRKLRNGKLRLVADSSRQESGAASPDHDQMDDVDMESASEATVAHANDAFSRNCGRQRQIESPRATPLRREPR